MKSFPWVYGIVTFAFGLLLLLSYVLVPNVPIGIVVKVILTILMTLWLIDGLSTAMEDRRQRAEILAAQDRFIARMASQAPMTFGMHEIDPTTGRLVRVYSQEEIDIRTLKAACKHRRHRDLLKPEMKLLLSMS